MYGEMTVVMTFLCNLGYCLCTGSALSAAEFPLFLFDVQMENSCNGLKGKKSFSNLM